MSKHIDQLKALVDLKAVEKKAPEINFAAARNAMLKTIDKTLELFNSNPKAKGKKYFVLVNDGVVLTLPFDTGAERKVEHRGRDLTGIPLALDKFPTAIKTIRAAVEAGEFDMQLGMLRGMKAAPTGGKRSGWSPERRAKQEATLAARKKK